MFDHFKKYFNGFLLEIYLMIKRKSTLNWSFLSIKIQILINENFRQILKRKKKAIKQTLIIIILIIINIRIHYVS